MWQLEQYEANQRKGLDAVERRDWRLGRFHLLKAAEYLLKAARTSGPDFQQLRQQQAHKLIALAKQCEERLKSGDTGPTAGTSGGAAGSDGTSPAAQGAGAGGGADKHLTDFRPMPPGDVTMASVVGLDEVKRQVRLKVIYPLEKPELFRQYRGSAGGGILLYGPPGTGKTMIAKAIAGEVKAPFFNVKPSDIMAPLVGVAERNVARLFGTLREAGRAVVFFDELDALLPARGEGGGDSGVMGRLVPQFLQELQGVTTKGGDVTDKFLLVLGATNVPWAIDPAVMRPGRFDELIYIPLPDLPARRLLFEMYTRDRPLGERIDFDILASRSEGLSGADIRDVCDTTSERVLERAIDAGGDVLPIEQADLEDALRKARRSVRDEHLRRFDEWAEGSRIGG